jgi:ketosteroid isomerase-like protein
MVGATSTPSPFDRVVREASNAGMVLRHAAWLVYTRQSAAVFDARRQIRGQEMTDDLIATARKYYLSYVDNDQAGIEAIIDEGFRFTSPWDNKIDRATYFDRCWPNNETITGFDFINLVVDGERVFVTYEGQSANGKPFRNTEIMTIRNGKVVDVEVYFGWLIPHDAPDGGFVDPQAISQPTSHPEDQAGGRRS